jgi:DNA-binding FrmR family transcriptional regulator
MISIPNPPVFELALHTCLASFVCAKSRSLRLVPLFLVRKAEAQDSIFYNINMLYKYTRPGTGFAYPHIGHVLHHEAGTMNENQRALKQQKKQHPDHSTQLAAISRIIGQLELVKKMIIARKYSPDIIQQIRAARGGLVASEVAVLGVHISNCIQEAILSDDKEEIEAKTAEVVKYVKKLVG